jgi:hypothetical protein
VTQDRTAGRRAAPAALAAREHSVDARPRPPVVEETKPKS